MVYVQWTFTILRANSGGQIDGIFLIFYTENMIWDFISIVSIGDNLHEMTNPVFLEKYFSMLYAENFTQNAKH